MNSVWIIPDKFRSAHRKEEGAAEYLPAKDYNELIDWIGEYKSCRWTVGEEGVWSTECGNMFEFISGGPNENGAKYCQYCGSKINQQAEGE